MKGFLSIEIQENIEIKSIWQYKNRPKRDVEKFTFSLSITRIGEG